jgi:O-antigen/teichoic acid export membrane protein
MPLIRKNIAANYAGQLYVTVMAIAILPLYLKYMGPEAYGLIGVFTLLSAWLSLLDIGLTPALGREVARLRKSTDDATQLRDTVRSLETIFGFIGAFVFLVLYLAKEWLVTSWLKLDSLDIELAADCLSLMGALVSLRWFILLHRSGINAYECQFYLNALDILVISLRYPGSLLLLAHYDIGILEFFSYQLALAMVELVFVSRKFYRLLPKTKNGVRLFSVVQMKRIAPFSLGIAYTSAIWTVVTQSDKTMFTKLLSLSEFGYFTLIITVAHGLIPLTSPVKKAILPRMTLLLAQNKPREMLGLYRKGTRLVVAVTAPVAAIICIIPEQVIFLWTNSSEAARWVAPILPLYVLADAILAVVAFQYYLQCAYGVLRQHIQFNTFSALLQIPAIFYAAVEYGPVGVGWVWLTFRFLTLLLWTPYIHKIFAPGLHMRWLLTDVMPSVAISLFCVLVLQAPLLQNMPEKRVGAILYVVGATIVLATITLTVAFWGEVRKYAGKRI